MEVFHGAKVVRTKYTWGLCLGDTIYVGERASTRSMRHEFGHHLQWKRLGKLYWLVIAIPSLVHCIIYEIFDRKWDYYSFYTEAWANRLASEYFGEDIMKN